MSDSVRSHRRKPTRLLCLWDSPGKNKGARSKSKICRELTDVPVCVSRLVQFSSVQLLSHVWLFATPWTAACQASLSITNSQSLLKLMSIESVMPSNHLILCRPLLLLPSIFPNIRVFSNELVLHIMWPKYWSFSFSLSPSNEYSGLISLRIDWFDVLAVQETLKSLLLHHSSKASILWHSAFFIVQLSHLYMTTGKTIALTRWTFVGKVMSLLLNMLSRLVIAFLPRSMQASFNFMAVSHHLQWFWNPRSAFPNPCHYQERPRESEQVNNYSIQKKRAYLISLALDI